MRRIEKVISLTMVIAVVITSIALCLIIRNSNLSEPLPSLATTLVVISNTPFEPHVTQITQPSPQPDDNQAVPSDAPPTEIIEDAPPTEVPWATEQLRNMTWSQKVGQMILMGVQGTAITAETCSQIASVMPGGIVFTGGNVINPDQLRQFTNDLQNCASTAGILPLLIAMDHEGYYVIRFDHGVTVFPPAMAVGASGDPNWAYLAAVGSGEELRYSGINMVLGPVADVLTDYDNAVISLRSYGGDAENAKLYVANAVRGYRDIGLIPAIKHYPGHGGVAEDSHFTFPVDNTSFEELQTNYLPPFSEGINAGAPVVMTSHIAFPAVDGQQLPATLSQSLISLLREQLGFDGIVLSDSMSMDAITGSFGTVSQASKKAVKAGVDLLLIVSPQQAQQTKAAIEEAINQGQIEKQQIDQSVERLLQLKYQYDLNSFPLTQASSPNWGQHATVAGQIASQSVTLVRNNGNLIPLHQSMRNLLIIGPIDGWGLYPVLENSLRTEGINFTIVTYSNYWLGAIPERSYLQSLPNQAASYDGVILFTWDSHINRFRFDDDWQHTLVNNMLNTNAPLIVVALKSPTDILDFPAISTYLATYGTTADQIRALVDILTGKLQPSGVNPLPKLP